MSSVLLAQAEGGSWIGPLLGMLCIPALVALNALFVAAEFALVSVRKTQVEEMIARGVTGAKAVEAALQRLDRAIAATQLGVTLASIGLGWAGEPALAQLVRPWFDALTGPWQFVAQHSVATVFAFLLITFMHVVFGELIPKNLALQSPVRIALWLAVPMNAFARLTRPLTLVMSGTANGILHLLGYRPVRGEEMVHSVEELALLIEDTEEAGILDPQQAELVQNVFRLSNKNVGDCMVPRERMAVLEVSMPPDKVLQAVRSGAHTRMPVFEGALDNIIGIVNTKDLFYLFSLKGVVVLEDALYPPLFLKAEENVANALRLFRRAHRPMALVRDEQGAVLGLVTLEDILEEIIGDIQDEHDLPTPKVAARLRRAGSALQRAREGLFPEAQTTPRVPERQNRNT